jgi:hypothetical protein
LGLKKGRLTLSLIEIEKEYMRNKERKKKGLLALIEDESCPLVLCMMPTYRCYID